MSKPKKKTIKPSKSVKPKYYVINFKATEDEKKLLQHRANENTDGDVTAFIKGTCIYRRPYESINTAQNTWAKVLADETKVLTKKKSIKRGA